MIYPVNDIVIVRFQPEEMENGIYVGRTDTVTSGEVYAIGPDVEGVEVGDVAYFGVAAGMMVVHKGEKLLVMRIKDIMGTDDAKARNQYQLQAG